jgi:DNA-binding ferritin-like protein
MAADAERAPSAALAPVFARWAGRVRARLALTLVLSGAAAGLVVGAAAAGVAWGTRHGALRPWTAAGGLVGAAAGLAIAQRRRFSDAEVALYLDARLGSKETIATSLDLSGGDARAAAHVSAEASRVLAAASPKAVRPRVLRVAHLGVPVGAAAIAWVSTLPLPPAPPAPPPPPGVEKVTLANIQGLEKVIRLESMDARDEKQRERLKKLSEDAKKLREKLQKGVEKREALDDMTKLRDALTAERMSLGEGERAGLESALGKLGEHPETRDAAKDLGDHDLGAFDEDMEKLADSVEKADRDRAKKALAEAAEAAKKGGAPGVAKALEEEQRLFKQREKKAEKLRELSKALGDALGKEGKQALSDFDRDHSPKAERKLAEALEEALSKLTPEQRKQLAENLKKQAAAAPESDGEDGPDPPTKKQLEEMAKQLDTPEGQKALADALKKMAQAPGDPSGEAERQKQLGEAQKGLGELGGQMGMPMPMPGANGGSPQAGNGPGGDDDKGQAVPGHSEGGGPGKHDGKTNAVDGKGVVAKADARLNGTAKPVPGTAIGRTTGRAGETANVQGTGALGAAGPSELGGIERSDVPEEYREQVGRYFQPH